VTVQIPALDLAPALVVLPGPRAGYADGGAGRPGDEGGGRPLRTPDARDLFEHGPVLVAHAAMTARG
jgi:ATP-dependent DNA helicase DinG